jgi:UDP-N-acetylglucosamine--N-acetylmuramyl-(pentapeptide) pyrophosphoryl-undecaprenol N-acetylglucosamine transferase
VRAQAARLIQERDLDAAVLGKAIAELAADRARLLAMAEAARAGAVTDAAVRLADSCLAVAEAA